jgi:hypothetical protein
VDQQDRAVGGVRWRAPVGEAHVPGIGGRQAVARTVPGQRARLTVVRGEDYRPSPAVGRDGGPAVGGRRGKFGPADLLELLDTTTQEGT